MKANVAACLLDESTLFLQAFAAEANKSTNTAVMV